MAKPLAVITGASSGIGAVFARKLARDHDLLLIARRKGRLEALASELDSVFGGKSAVLQADLTDEQDLAGIEQRISAEPSLSLLVNNAGFGTRGLFWDVDISEQTRMHRLHTEVILRLCHTALRNMVPRNAGAIINVASVAAFVQRAGSTEYGATKRWVTAFTEGLHLELKQIGSAVRVQALCPGYTYSEFHDVLHLDRTRIASPALWLTAERVVDDSLAGLQRGKLFVIPGWPYKMIVALLGTLPNRLRLVVGAGSSNPKASSSGSDRWDLR